MCDKCCWSGRNLQHGRTLCSSTINRTSAVISQITSDHIVPSARLRRGASSADPFSSPTSPIYISVPRVSVCHRHRSNGSSGWRRLTVRVSCFRRHVWQPPRVAPWNDNAMTVSSKLKFYLFVLVGMEQASTHMLFLLCMQVATCLLTAPAEQPSRSFLFCFVSLGSAVYSILCDWLSVCYQKTKTEW